MLKDCARKWYGVYSASSEPELQRINSIVLIFCSFGPLSYQTESVSRTLKLTNTACVPITIAWHIFVNEIQYQKDGSVQEVQPVGSKIDPFNLVLDVFSPPNTDCYSDLDFFASVTKIDLSVSPYYGKEEYYNFQVII